VCDDAPPAVTVRPALPQANCRQRLSRKPSDVEVMVWQILGISDHDVCEHDVIDVALCAFWSPCMQTLCDQAATITVLFSHGKASWKAPKRPRRLNTHGSGSMPEHSVPTRITGCLRWNLHVCRVDEECSDPIWRRTTIAAVGQG
jgi:hypothetical protein